MSYSDTEKNLVEKWKEDNTFQKQIYKNRLGTPFTFYDGPPFATGLPHYGHIVASTIKDMVPRYKAMNGYNVPRKWGWDCIAEGTLINLSDGVSIPIESFDYLCKVESFDTDLKKFVEKNKTNFISKGSKECVELFFENGCKLVCTPDHELFTKNGWMKAINIIMNETEIYTNQVNPSLSLNEKPWEFYVDHIHLNTYSSMGTRKSVIFCRIIGYILSASNFFDDEKDVIQFVNDISIVFRERAEYRRSSFYYVNFSRDFRFLENYRSFPNFIIDKKTPLVMKQEFLAGFFGGIKNNETRKFSIDTKIYNYILYLLTEVGVKVEVNGDNYDIELKTSEEVEIFYSKVGFRYANRKNRKVENLTKLICRINVGPKKVYDISVQETHNFVANGIVVHNCHGLPIEFEIEKKLGIKTKEQIMELGIDKYNEECRSIVMTYSNEWKKTIDRIGRWVDMESDYKTMDIKFMDIVWQIFGKLWEKGLVYQGVKVMPYSTACTTPLSNFEAKLNYRNVQDPSIIIKFRCKSEIETYFLVWTTTPWTLPSNLAICVHPDMEYGVYEKDNKLYILLEKLAEKHGFNKNIRKFAGSELVGKEYEPLFDCFKDRKGFRVVSDKYVTDTNGTGIVHQAPAFGEDDYRICLENEIIGKMEIPPCPFNDNGYFTSDVQFLEGVYFKDADKIVIKKLKEMNLLFGQATDFHDYPFCWRSNTPLMYRIVPCTFINVEKIRDEIVRVNSTETRWVPDHVREGRFGMWLKEARDWCVSRNRYWGTPIPIWKSTDGEMICVNSVEELEKLTGQTIVDIHRHKIDHLEIIRDGKKFKRIEEVFDCWFESGSVPFASQGDLETQDYPADFIAEGLDQTRGWFYTLMVLGVALRGQTPFKNVIVNGLVLAEDGEKMSKSKKNYPDPSLIIEKYGADALRLYLISQGVVKGDSLKFREEGVKMIVQNINIFAHNTLSFLKQMIPFYQQKYSENFVFYMGSQRYDKIKNVMDILLLNYLQEFVNKIHAEMKVYNLSNIVYHIEVFIGKLSRTYLNMNKSRLKSMYSKEEALNSLNTLFYAFEIFSIMIAPFAPFMADYFFQEMRLLRGKIKFKSVHLKNMPVIVWKNDKTENAQEGFEIIEALIEARGELRSKVLKSAKKPVKKQFIFLDNWRLIPLLEEIHDILLKECNTIEIEISSRISNVLEISFEINTQNLGKRFKKDAKRVKEKIEFYMTNNYPKCLEELKKGKIVVNIDNEPQEFFKEIQLIYKLDRKKINKIQENLYEQYFPDKGLVILSDLTWNEELENIYWLRVISRKLMQLRRDVGLIPTDCAEVCYKNLGTNLLIENNCHKLAENLNMFFRNDFDLQNYKKYSTIILEEEDLKYELTIALL